MCLLFSRRDKLLDYFTFLYLTMMRFFLVMSLGALTLACAHKDAGKSLKKLGFNNTPATEATDPERSFDSTIFIGYVGYFPETDEFYTALFYQNGHEYPDEELLESKLDSVIIFDDDWDRERLPMEEAKKILVLSGLDSLCIYNREHRLVSRSALCRVEFLWNGLESYFIAVYNAGGSYEDQKEKLYGISSGYEGSSNSLFSAEEIKDRQLNEYLVEKLNISRRIDWDMRHYRMGPSEETYSIISSYSMTSNEAFSYLTSLEKNHQVKVLNKEVDNYHFLDILPVPIQVNGKPLLLISAGYPSSDVLWDYLAGYNGVRYEPIDFNRIAVRSIDQ